ncbi:MAG: hypothetical protein ACOCT9_02710 [archaeon]
MALDGTQLCYIIVLVAAVILVVWGFMELLRQRQKDEHTETQVISRQIRGFAFIMLGQVVLVLGAMLCFGMSGGVEEMGKKLRKLSSELM